nr:NADAR family protein [Eubacterium sp.]
MSNIICFYHEYEEYGCFSNWYRADFENARRKFSSVEQYMMYQKAVLFREYGLAEKILATNDPAKIKKLGRSHMKRFDADVWDKISKQVVKRGVRAKFEQNEELLEMLLATGDAVLAECSRNDRKWGIGVGIRETNRYDTSTWCGKNLLGRVLMEVREELRRGKERGVLGYVDAYDLEFEQWQMKPGDLKCIPKFYDAVHAYADTLVSDDMRRCFYGHDFAGWDLAMRTNMGGGLPAIGFYEMKQDIYDTVRYG